MKRLSKGRLFQAVGGPVKEKDLSPAKVFLFVVGTHSERSL